MSMKYKFVADEDNVMEHYWEGNKIEYGDVIELNETPSKIKVLIKHGYFEEAPDEENTDEDN